MPSNTLDIPPTVAVCPYCAGPLYLEVDEWDAETGVPTEAGAHIWCVHVETDDDVDRHTNMPYVYWLPVQRIVNREFTLHCRVEGDALIYAPPPPTPLEEMRRAGAAPLPGFEVPQ